MTDPIQQCPQSGEVQMLSWFPVEEEDYPGAVVCLGCSFGVLIVKGTEHKARSEALREKVAKMQREVSGNTKPALVCADPDCDASVPNHAWGKIKAEGWFFQKDGTCWCPKHLPEWVPQWRKTKGNG